jgi:hypothetical protein
MLVKLHRNRAPGAARIEISRARTPNAGRSREFRPSTQGSSIAC